MKTTNTPPYQGDTGKEEPKINYETAGEKYVALEKEVERIEKEAKTKTAELKKVMVDLENWFTLKAQEDGLSNIKTAVGTAYWSVHHKATVASRDALFGYCRANDAWDLLEARASKEAVKSFIEGHGIPPPGVNYASVKVFNFRKSTKE